LRARQAKRSRGWLAPADAWEGTFERSGDASELRRLSDAVDAAIGTQPIDVNVVTGDPRARRKRLMTADMESTIIAQEMLDEMADLVGCRAEIEAVTAAAMRGELNFEASLEKRVSLFKGLDVARLDGLRERITLMPGAATLIRTLKTHGTKTALVTGGFTIFAAPVADQLGFDSVIANVLEVDNGKLTGRVVPPIVGPQGKADALARLSRELGLDAAETLAVGDGANDCAMLAAAGLGVAFRAKPKLADQARAASNGAVIRHGELTALLYLQGYAFEELVT
jgi:phosphoserine phosphatase